MTSPTIPIDAFLATVTALVHGITERDRSIVAHLADRARDEQTSRGRVAELEAKLGFLEAINTGHEQAEQAMAKQQEAATARISELEEELHRERAERDADRNEWQKLTDNLRGKLARERDSRDEWRKAAKDEGVERDEWRKTAERLSASLHDAETSPEMQRARAVQSHETQATISKWALDTFGPCEVDRAVTRAIEEMREFIQVRTHSEGNPAGYTTAYAKEAADVVVCLYRVFDLLGIDLHDEVDRVMKINRDRVWVSDGKGCGQHVKVKLDGTSKGPPWTEDVIVRGGEVVSCRSCSSRCPACDAVRKRLKSLTPGVHKLGTYEVVSVNADGEPQFRITSTRAGQSDNVGHLGEPNAAGHFVVDTHIESAEASIVPSPRAPRFPCMCTGEGRIIDTPCPKCMRYVDRVGMLHDFAPLCDDDADSLIATLTADRERLRQATREQRRQINAQHQVVLTAQRELEAATAQLQAIREFTGRVDAVEGVKLLADEVADRGAKLETWRSWAIGKAGNGWAARAAAALCTEAALHEGDDRARELLAHAVEEVETWHRWATNWAAEVPDEPSNNPRVASYNTADIMRWKLATAATHLKRWRAIGIDADDMSKLIAASARAVDAPGLYPSDLPARLDALGNVCVERDRMREIAAAACAALAEMSSLWDDTGKEAECLMTAWTGKPDGAGEQAARRVLDEVRHMAKRERTLREAVARAVEALPESSVDTLVNQLDGRRELLTCIFTALKTDLLPVLVSDGLLPNPDLEARAHDPHAAVRVIEAAANLLRQYNTVRREDRAALDTYGRSLNEALQRESVARIAIREVTGWRGRDDLEGVRDEAARLRQVHRAIEEFALGDVGLLLGLAAVLGQREATLRKAIAAMTEVVDAARICGAEMPGTDRRCSLPAGHVSTHQW